MFPDLALPISFAVSQASILHDFWLWSGRNSQGNGGRFVRGQLTCSTVFFSSTGENREDQLNPQPRGWPPRQRELRQMPQMTLPMKSVTSNSHLPWKSDGLHIRHPWQTQQPCLETTSSKARILFQMHVSSGEEHSVRSLYTKAVNPCWAFNLL